MVRKMAKKAAAKVDASAVRTLQEGLRAEVAARTEDPETGLMPGEVRGRGQLPELDAKLAMQNDEPQAESSSVVMVKDGIELDVEPENVEAHKRQGFVVRDEMPIED